MLLAEFAGADGRLGKIIQSEALAINIPRSVKIVGSDLHWKGGSFERPKPESLQRFIELWRPDVPDSAIPQFAEEFGTLRPPLRSSFLKQSRRNHQGREPLAKWRSLSKHAYNLLMIGAALKNNGELDGKRLVDSQWDSLMLRETLFDATFLVIERVGTAVGPKYRKVDAARTYLYCELLCWNNTLGPVSMHLEADQESYYGWKAVLDFGGSLTAYLGLQLMQTIAGGSALVCSACHRPYIRPSRQKLLDDTAVRKGLRKMPNPGHMNYCHDRACDRERNRAGAAKRKREERRRKKKS
jgi:hypothetical protein